MQRCRLPRKHRVESKAIREKTGGRHLGCVQRGVGLGEDFCREGEVPHLAVRF